MEKDVTILAHKHNSLSEAAESTTRDLIASVDELQRNIALTFLEISGFILKMSQYSELGEEYNKSETLTVQPQQPTLYNSPLEAAYPTQH